MPIDPNKKGNTSHFFSKQSNQLIADGNQVTMNEDSALPCKLSPVVSFPEKKVEFGRARAIPVRLRTSEGLKELFDGLLQGHLEDVAVIFDFDKVLANAPLAKAEDEVETFVRGGRQTIAVIETLKAHGVPLFIATARSSEDSLKSLLEELVEREKYGLGRHIFAPDSFHSFKVQVVEEKIKKVSGTNIYSAGLQKEKVIAHISEICKKRKKIVFIDDNVFNSYFVLQEAPEIIHKSNPERDVTIVSAWWDPSQEQCAGKMKIIHDSDFSYSSSYQECLNSFGVDECERIRVEEVLLAQSLLRVEKNG